MNIALEPMMNRVVADSTHLHTYLWQTLSVRH